MMQNLTVICSFLTCDAGPLTKRYDPEAVRIHHLLVVDQTNLLRRQNSSDLGF